MGTSNPCRDTCEELSVTEFKAHYDFLPLNDIKSIIRMDRNHDGVPNYYCAVKVCDYPTDEPFLNYEVTLMKPIVPCLQRLHYSLLIIWETNGMGSQNEKIIWFKTSRPHGLQKGKSVVLIQSEIQKLNGYFLVDSVSWEVGKSVGPTLFSIFAEQYDLMDLPADGSGKIWAYQANSVLAECFCQSELSHDEGTYKVVQKPHQQKADSVPLLPQIEEHDSDLAELVSVSDHQTGLSAAESRSTSSSEKQDVAGNSPVPDQSSSSFGGFGISEITHEVDPKALFPNPSSSNVFLEDSQLAESSSMVEVTHGESESENERAPSPAFTDGAKSDATDWTPIQIVSNKPEIIPDKDSTDEENEEDELPEIVPFSEEELSLEPLDFDLLDKNLIVSKFSTLLHDLLMDIRYPARMILFDDQLASHFYETFIQEISASLPDALMRKGRYACLVPQKLFGAVRRGLHKQELAYQHYGGILLHVLSGLDKASIEKQLDLVTYNMELSPSNPFEHLLKEGELPSVSLVPGCGSSTTISTRMPHLASIIEPPDLSTLSDQQVKILFKNAGYLMKNESRKPKFLNKMKDYVGQKASGPLRKYQQECIDRFMTGENYVCVAPTGAGKTKIFVECSRKLLVKKKTATIVVLCPTVPLATQQACVYVVERFLEQGYWVNTFSSENPLPANTWECVAKTHNVMVLTPQILINVLDHYREYYPGSSVFEQIDLLILDECHHVRKEHAYNKIIKELRKNEKRTTQVLGFTASPTSSPTVKECQDNFRLLLDQLQARCVVLTDANAEVQAHVPSAREETAYAELRQADADFARCMGRFLLNATTRYMNPLVGTVRGVLKLSDSCANDMAKGTMSAYFENWAKETVESVQLNQDLEEFDKIDIICSIELLRSCNTSLELIVDAGFESGVRYLSIQICSISRGFQFDTGIASWMFPKLLSGVYSTKSIQSIDPVLQTFNMCPYGSICSKYPRFIQLVKFLERYKEQDQLHGIVFVKSRDGVFHLAEMLRKTYSLRHMCFMEFTGHGQSNKKTKSIVVSPHVNSPSARGMTGSKQQDTLERFSAPGRHVLCATSAAEEGINVTSCQFVVRYSVTYTGIQRVQSRGRSRVSGGIFFNIIQRESKETKFLEKSQQEEINMDIVLRTTNRVEHL